MVELMAVVGIIGIAALMVVPSTLRLIPDYYARGARDRAHAVFASARMEAVSRSAPTEVRWVPGSRSIRVWMDVNRNNAVEDAELRTVRITERQDLVISMTPDNGVFRPNGNFRPGSSDGTGVLTFTVVHPKVRTRYEVVRPSGRASSFDTAVSL